MTAGYWPFIDIFRDYFAWKPEDGPKARADTIVTSLGGMVERGELTQQRSQEMGPLLGVHPGITALPWTQQDH